jgi:hypothetical protein
MLTATVACFGLTPWATPRTGSACWLTSAFGRHQYAFMRTTIDLPDPLLKEAKAVAALRDQTLREMFVSALRRELRDGRAKEQLDDVL